MPLSCTATMKPDGDTLCKDLARNLARPRRALSWRTIKSFQRMPIVSHWLVSPPTQEVWELLLSRWQEKRLKGTVAARTVPFVNASSASVTERLAFVRVLQQELRASDESRCHLDGGRFEVPVCARRARLIAALKTQSSVMNKR